MLISTTSLGRIGEQTCVLLGSDELPDTIAMTGVELLLPVAAAAGVLILGLALIVAARRRKRTSEPRPVHGAVLVGIVGALAITLASIAGPARAEAESSAADGCALIDFRNEYLPAGVVIDGAPTEVQRVALRNVTAFDIDIAFSALVDRDDAGLAPYVRVVGSCSCRSQPVLDGALSSSVETSDATTIRLRSEESVTVTLSAATTSAIDNDLQGASASYTLVAHARQATS